MMTDRFKDALIAIINDLIPERRYLAHVEYRVTKSADGKIEAIPDDQTSGYQPVRDVVVRGFFAANGSELVVGSSILIGWERGRREAPYVADVLDSPKSAKVEATTSIDIAAPSIVLNNGVQPIARVGDTVAGIFAITSGSTTIKGG